MAFEKTFFGNVKAQMASLYQAIAGVDSDGTPRLLSASADGSLRTVNTIDPPKHDDIEVSYYGSTNNVHVVTYKLVGTTVGTVTISYAGSGIADDDRVTSVVKAGF